jgi:site-specific recombinase XerD
MEALKYLEELRCNLETFLQSENSLEKIDFFEFAEEYIKKMRNTGRSKKSCENYETAVRNLAKFLGRNANLDFNEMTSTFRKKYCDWMTNSNLGKRGQELYLVSIRTIFNEALSTFNDYDIGEIKIRTNPFKDFTIPKFQFVSLAEKKALSTDMLQKIFAAPVSTKREELAKDVFMLSFCLCGMNAIDLYTCNKIKGTQLIYFRHKTRDRRNDNAEVRINIPSEVMCIFNKYRSTNGECVFSFANLYSESGGLTTAVNKGLKSISKKLGLGLDEISLYYARHSWATIAFNEVCLPDALVDECLVHAPLHRMLRSYVKKDWSRIDKANRKVLDYVFYGKTPPKGSVSI